MAYGHYAAHHERRAPQYAYTTQIVAVTVTAGSPKPSQNYQPYYQQPSYSVGPAVAPTVPASIPTPVYHAPPVRHQRPPQQSSSGNSKPPVRHQHPENKPKNPPVRSHRPHQPTAIEPPKKTHLHAGQPILHAPTASSSTALPSITSTKEHSSDQVSPNKVTSDEGMSGGAKAGIAIGILLVIGLIAGLAFFLYRKKKNQNQAHQPLDDEKTDLNKSNSLASHVSVRRTVANAPRLSLRPVTEMFPAEKQENKSASTMIANSAALARPRTPEPPKPMNPFDEKSDPFGDHAAAPNAADDPMVTAPAAVVPKPLSIKSGRTGTGISERSMSSDSQIASAAGAGSAPPNARRMSPPGPGPNNVHRVQLDFNPSMDDELGLRAGQLVRMLHEYDDGWALCVRLDRSQQGVVPRTCLSKLPVKPRPQGPPQGMRGPPPQGRPRGPPHGPGPRAPPNGRLRSQSNAPRHPRPESPVNGRMGGPGPRPRANSDAMSARRITPPNMTSPVSSASTSPTQGGAVPSRKPVPGQAM